MMEKEIWENTGQQPGNEEGLDQQTAVDNSSGPNDMAAGENEAAPRQEIEKFKAEVQEYKEKYLRQVAEFDNFRKRNARERLELIQTAGKDVIVSMLDVLDDCERAQQQVEKTLESSPATEGILLVFNKLRNTLYAKGLKPMESIGQEFNPDVHEAVTEVPVPSEEMKGKVVDEVQKGYYLNDKIIRFAKVVVGK